MLPARWSTLGGRDCIRFDGASTPGPTVRVVDAPADFPAVGGDFESDGGDRCFVPRFPFADGVGYVVVDAEGRASQPLRRTPTVPPSSTTVVRILPTASAVPRNLLRFAIEFSSPMSEGGATGSIHLLTDDGRQLPGALLPTEYELWDGSRTRLTVLLDPGRIKQGLARHELDGYPLALHRSVRLVVDATMRDARGALLRTGSERRYRVVEPWPDRVDPQRWGLRSPAPGTVEPLEVVFDRSLDHALLRRGLRLLGPDGLPVAGRASIGAEERSWRFIPAERWRRAAHRVEIEATLEDLAGNTVARPFDRDITTPEPAGRARGAALRFTPGRAAPRSAPAEHIAAPGGA